MSPGIGDSPTLLTYAPTAGIQRLYGEASEFGLGLFLKFGFQQFDIKVVERQGVKFRRYRVEKILPDQDS